MENANKDYCTQCPNQCPVTDLKCGRGRNYFSQTEGKELGKNQEQSNHWHGEPDEHYQHRHGHGGRPECMHKHGEGCEHKHKHGRGLCYEKDNLYGMMRACGHYLYHRSGSGAGQGKILAILSQRESMTQKELQEMLQIQPGSMSEILTKLEEKGLILRKKHDDDRRMSVLVLTDAGKDVAENQRQQEDEASLFAALEDAEREELKKLLGKLLDSWK